MSDLIIKQTTHSEIQHLIPLASKEKILFPPSVTLYAAELDGKIVGCCGVTWFRHKAEFKSSFVLPEFRGQGIFKAMCDYRLGLVKEKNVRLVVATCTGDSISEWLRRGAKITKTYKSFFGIEFNPNEVSNA